jgi:hypothetical protein
MHSGAPTLHIRRSATGQACTSPPVSRMAIRRPLPFSICECLDLRVAPPARAANSLFSLPLFRLLRSGALSHEWSRSSASLRTAHFQQVAETDFPRSRARPSEQTVIDQRLGLSRSRYSFLLELCRALRPHTSQSKHLSSGPARVAISALRQVPWQRLQLRQRLIQQRPAPKGGPRLLRERFPRRR